MKTIKDLTGERFGSWVIKEFGYKDKYNHAKWVCVCDCGTVRTLFGADLISGRSVSCGCMKARVLRDKIIEDMVGKKFDRLTIMSFDHEEGGHYFWNCLCDCGNMNLVSTPNLNSGNIKSCGCWRKERITDINTTHGLSKHYLYNVWRSMIARCYYTLDSNYKRYGGRGITVCDRWRHPPNGFLNFLKDMGDRPEGTTLDRKDNSKGYLPENCIWATPKRQSRNRRSNRLLIYNGEKKCISQWAEEYGMRPGTLIARLERGKSVEEALTKSVETKYRKNK